MHEHFGHRYLICAMISALMIATNPLSLSQCDGEICILVLVKQKVAPIGSLVCPRRRDGLTLRKRFTFILLTPSSLLRIKFSKIRVYVRSKVLLILLLSTILIK